MIFKQQFTNASYPKLIVSVQGAMKDANSKYLELLQKVSTQGNASNIPGLS